MTNAIFEDYVNQQVANLPRKYSYRLVEKNDSIVHYKVYERDVCHSSILYVETW